MLFKKYKIWFLLVVTLVFTYFAPPKDNVLLASGVDNPNLDKQTSLFTQGDNLKPRPSQSIKVLKVQERAAGAEESEELDMFSVGYRTSLATPSKKRVNTLITKTDTPSTNLSATGIAENIPPQAPPLPFKVLGKYTEDGNQVIFIQYNNQNLVLHVGDVFLEKYKWEAIEENSLIFNYLPMELKQTINLAH